ncbi:unnamed protein product [Blepharisma stoltei]|uniref:Uncharacterized protein n=1 Tax=Blepharisma stoltei TaxID=1481888 RepID=A0AAU9J013_9CILI|nr:unnamed protein product [Blepharisma stoltei]
MGCKASVCTDPNELLLSQHIQEKDTDISSHVSQKSTLYSLNTLIRRKEEAESFIKPQEKIRTTVKMIFKSSQNRADLIEILEIWLNEVYTSLEESVFCSQDLKSYLSVDSTGLNMTIKHDVDGIRSYNCLKNFCEKLRRLPSCSNLRFNSQLFSRHEEFLLSLCPLTISFYLKLGAQIDCGFGVEKPMDKKQLSQFLLHSAEAENVARWSNQNSHPIPIQFNYSCFNDARFCNFYLFDGLKSQNFERGISMFEWFGAPVSSDVANIIRRAKGEEVNCIIEIDKESVISMAMQVQEHENPSAIAKELDTAFDKQKWVRFQKLLQPKWVILELNRDGFRLVQMSAIM